MTIFDYIDYRKYLRDYYAKKKGEGSYFSHRYFSRIAGVGPFYLRLVMKGERNLSPNTILKFTKALKFNKKEAAYFENLVLYNQATSDKEKELYLERVMALRPSYYQVKGLEKDQLSYFIKKHYVIIREMTALPNFKEDPAWIGSQFTPHLKTKEVVETIEALLRLGLLTRNDQGILKHSDATVQAPPEAHSLELFEYHRAILRDARDAILNVDCEKREIISLTIPISFETLPKVKEALRQSQENLVHIINSSSHHADEIFQINVQCFPVTHTRQGKEIL